MVHKHIMSITVNDHPGVLQRVSSLFTRRGFNIESISVGKAEEIGLSRMVIVASGDRKTFEQMQKQLYKIIDVIKVTNLSDYPLVAREIALIKVQADSNIRVEILGIVETFRATVVDVHARTLMIQVVGDSEKIEAMLELMRPYGIQQVSRTGITALMRGNLN